MNSASTAEDDTPFPTTPGAYDTSSGQYCKTKAFIARLYSEENGSDWYMNDSAFDVAIDADGNIVVAGRTRSADFPVTDNCADAGFQGESEAFASKFDPDLGQLLASTFIGRANEEKANVLAIDANNEIVVAGWTKSSDFPVVQGNYDTSYSVYEDGFVSRLNSELAVVTASAFIGGSGTEDIGDDCTNAPFVIFKQTDALDDDRNGPLLPLLWDLKNRLIGSGHQMARTKKTYLQTNACHCFGCRIPMPLLVFWIRQVPCRRHSIRKRC